MSAFNALRPAKSLAPATPATPKSDAQAAYDQVNHDNWGGVQDNATWVAQNRYNAANPDVHGGARAQSYNTSYDKLIGMTDKQIASLEAYGANITDAQKQELATHKSARSYANAQRWQSAMSADVRTAGMQQLQDAVDRGVISWQDVGNSIDITKLGDDPALVQSVKELIASKQAPAVATPEGTPTSSPEVKADVDASLKAAGVDIASAWTGVSDFVNSQHQGGLAAFDQRLGEQEAGLASAAGGVGRKLGGAAGAAMQSNAGAQLEAKAQAERKALSSDVETGVQEQMTKLLENNIHDNTALASLDADQKLKVQEFAAQSFVDQLNEHIASAGGNASAELTALGDTVKAWQAAEAGTEQKDALFRKLVGAGAGLLSRVGAAALA